MSDNKETKETKENRIRLIIQEEVKNALEKIIAQVPKGYVRCKVCGALIKDTYKDCPYCIIDDKDDDDDIIDIE